MCTESDSVHRLSNDDLINHVHRLAADERGTTTRLIGALGELDVRRLYLGEGYSSLFTYCTRVLHLSEHAAYARIEAARAARRFPVVLELLAEGTITLTTVTLLSAHLSPDNHRVVLEAAKHRSKREVEQLVASLRPMPAVPTSIRKLPQPKSVLALPLRSAAPPTVAAAQTDMHPDVSEQPSFATISRRPSTVLPLAPERYRIQFTASAATHGKLRRAQDLLRHVVPDGDVASIVDRALTLLVRQLERRKLAAVDRPRAPLRKGEQATVTNQPGARSRYVPAEVRRRVWARDGGQCAFVGTKGRCTERGFLELHHVKPFADGGAASAENLELRCRAHNAHEAQQHLAALDAGSEDVAEVAAAWKRAANGKSARRKP